MEDEFEMPQKNPNLKRSDDLPSVTKHYLTTCQRAINDLLNATLGLIKENCPDCKMKKDCPPFFIYAEAYRIMLMFLLESISRYCVDKESAKDEKTLALIRCEMCRQVTETNSFLFATGKCMEPLINEGDLIVKHKLPLEELREGDIIVYPSFRRLQGGKIPFCVVHKILKVEDDRFVLTDTSGHIESVDKHLVCGKVVKIIEKGKNLWKDFSQILLM